MSPPPTLARVPLETLGGIEVGGKEVRRALILSFWDGLFATAMVALTETFGIAAAVSLDAPSMAIAVLGSVPLLLGSLGQYFLPAVVDIGKARKRQVLVGVGLQSLLLYATAATGLLRRPYGAWVYVGTFALAGVCANVTVASWVSWMGDLVPLQIRGRHFAWRNRLFSIVNLSVALIAGLFAAGYAANTAPWRFFVGVFVTAATFRALGFQMLKRQYEPLPVPLSVRPDWRASPSRDFTLFSVAHGLVQGASAMSAPFFAVWYLRDLGFSYLALAITSCAMIAGSILALPAWGALTDHVGSRTTLRIAGLLVSLVPLPYLFFTSRWSVWAINFGGGVAWAGYNLVAFNHMLAASENKRRERLFAFAAVVTGVIVFSTTLVGGFVATRLPVLFTWRLQTLFLVSAALRLAAFASLFPHLEEYAPRANQKAEDLFFQIPGYRVGLGLLRNFFRAFRG